MRLRNKIQNFTRNFEFLKVYTSPFKSPKIKWYIGKISIGTPHFFPRKLVKSKTKPGYSEFKPKKIGFDFVGLGWKTKWSDTDYRFEWSPVWSFVFFKWQAAVLFIAPNKEHYWECWLYYDKNTDKTKPVKDRIAQARDEFPCVWKVSSKGTETIVCYWDIILKDKWL